MLRRIIFSLLLAISITSVHASDTEDKVINGFRFQRTPETKIMIYDQTNRNIGNIFPENKLELLDPFLIEDTLIPALPSVFKEFSQIQEVKILPDLDNHSGHLSASDGLLEPLLSHDIASIIVFSLEVLKDNDVTSLPVNTSLQHLWITFCTGKDDLIASRFTNLLSKLKALKRLNIPERIAANIEPTSLAGLENLTLCVSELDVKIQDIVQLPSLKRLHVNIRGNETDNIRKLAEGLKARTSPLFLELSCDTLTESHFQTLFEKQKYPQITGLNLSSGRMLTPQALFYMDSAFADNTLHTLVLDTPALKGEGLEIVVKSPYFKSLTCLSLPETTLNNQDVQPLMSSIATNTTLQVLRVGGSVTDVQPLLNGENTTLTALSLGGMQFDRPKVEGLFKLPGLTELDFKYYLKSGEKLLETFNNVRTSLTSLERLYINGVGKKSEQTLVDILNKGDVTKPKSNHPFDKYF
ncbi:MAG: hypothetical protein J0H12_07155 [Candidatus Paracaedimonas acanthamoebae]|uniref:Uncharacterized protein n=1 Tax=Candidatus Paracaedimonas acanthamoebae TaxID=244581 RepID=A0A8J7TV00_9PROT|nr:hypothetical protein [Candidatus Paracaedimonas acanthamoebae]